MNVGVVTPLVLWLLSSTSRKRRLRTAYEQSRASSSAGSYAGIAPGATARCSSDCLRSWPHPRLRRQTA